MTERYARQCDHRALPHPSQDRLSQSQRRLASARRMPALDCGCSPDPWLCHCTEPPLSTRAVNGWRDAANYLLAQGKTPLLPVEVLQALWRRGGADGALAEELHSLSGGEVA
ncbi:uncharacterized protein RMCC_2616 [Mycolicibacterium canariasense]|uniref:Uncharacterized protein n=1 Tax=Mycolicibacterium canariasense TaxID=228230 RepID=A0A100WCM7_MYCCR|nr:uncharacterized protein RMCC_2616 [Mycolicibacterium canariasense]